MGINGRCRSDGSPIPEANVRVLVELKAALVEVLPIRQCGTEFSKHHSRNVDLGVGLVGLQTHSQLRLKGASGVRTSEGCTCGCTCCDLTREVQRARGGQLQLSAEEHIDRRAAVSGGGYGDSDRPLQLGVAEELSCAFKSKSW